ncbi:gag-protease polyprotein [Trifolium medium]|uniref:Gag-protease polyprotein n=1 Tax=Trifolium medium TaxID=97028 RepID=A0A392M5N9_9FABA|nr:gag-protease polyprotein [Trifolium medium]
MVAFLKSIDSKTWKAVLKGWTPPVIIDKEGKSTHALKAEEDWSKEEDALALGNSKALNALFNGVDTKMFKLIKHCIIAKDAWEVLKTYNEGTKKVKMAKLQLLTTKFETLKMKEDETIHDFHMNIMDIANSSESLGEKMSEEKLVRKILRSLPKRFDMKVTAVEEANDISEMQVDELIGSLQTFEVAISERSESKHKSIVFVPNTEEEDTVDVDNCENLSEAIALLGRQLNRVRQGMEKKSGTNGRNISSNINKGETSQKKQREEDQSNQKNVQCFECEGFGHIRTECPSFVKRQKKSLMVFWSDGDTDSEEEHEAAKYAKAFTGICSFDKENEVSYEEVCASYRQMSARNEVLESNLDHQDKLITALKEAESKLHESIFRLQDEKEELQAVIDDLETEVSVLNYKLESVTKELHAERTIKQNASPKKPGFAQKMSRQLLQHPAHHQRSTYGAETQKKICYYCGKVGHIKAYCYSLYGFPVRSAQSRNNHRSTWRPKGGETSFIAHTSFRVSSRDDWYFDSGCSKHMTGAESSLTKLKSCPTSYVTFGDGAKGEIKGVGKLIDNGLPKLDNVLLVKGLTANLISISQLCDMDLHVNFTKTGCNVTNDKQEVLMKGIRSKDNCYLWVPQHSEVSSTCLMSKEDGVQL